VGASKPQAFSIFNTAGFPAYFGGTAILISGEINSLTAAIVISSHRRRRTICYSSPPSFPAHTMNSSQASYDPFKLDDSQFRVNNQLHLIVDSQLSIIRGPTALPLSSAHSTLLVVPKDLEDIRRRVFKLREIIR